MCPNPDSICRTVSDRVEVHHTRTEETLGYVSANVGNATDRGPQTEIAGLPHPANSRHSVRRSIAVLAATMRQKLGRTGRIS